MVDNENQKAPRIKWYHRPLAVLIAILCVGPFALPLAWTSPAFKKGHKIIITLLVTGLTIWLIHASVTLYKILLGRLEELNQVLCR